MDNPAATPALIDVVDTAADADDLMYPPLLVRQPVEAALDRASLGTGPIRETRIGAGHSNVTFLLERDNWCGVLRRPPRPPFQPKAHDVLREARVQRALAATAVQVPALSLVEQDPTALGVPYYVMEWLDGVIITDSIPTGFDTASSRRDLGFEFVEQLAQLHLVDYAKAGLTDLGRSESFAARQLHTFGRLWASHSTRSIPALDEVESWLRSHLPSDSARPALIHGDFRLANVMFATDMPVRVRALLDWELSTIGDPLSDLGYLISTYPESPTDTGTLLSEAAAVAAGGFPTRAELIERYAGTTGADLTALDWWVTLAFWRTAVGLESFYRRAVAGTTDDPFIHDLREGVPELAGRALAAMQGGV